MVSISRHGHYFAYLTEKRHRMQYLATSEPLWSLPITDGRNSVCPLPGSTTGHMLESPETNIDTATLEKQVCRDSRRPLSKIWSSLAAGIAISPYSSSLACTPCPECA